MNVACSKYYRLDQDSQNRMFLLELQQKHISLRFCELLALRGKLIAIELDSLFYDETCPHNFKIVTLCNQQHLVLLTIEELLDLRELLNSAFTRMGVSQGHLSVYA